MLTLYKVAIFAAVTVTAMRLVQLYKHRKHGEPLPADWGYSLVQNIGFSLFISHYLLPDETPPRWSFSLALLGINLMLVGAFGTLRRLWGKRKSPPMPERERIANR